MNQEKIKVKQFLQSREWAQFQASIGREHIEFESDVLSAHCFVQKNALGMQYIYCPYGPVLHELTIENCGHDPFREYIDWVREQGVRLGASYVAVEPTSDFVGQMLAGRGFLHQDRSLQPSRTILVDLQKPASEIEAGLHPKFRYNIRVARRDGVVIRESSDIQLFITLLKQTTERDGFSAHHPSYYAKLINFFGGEHGVSTRLIFAYLDEKPIAGCLVLEYNGVGTYLHGASDHEYRKYMAPQLLHWEIMMDLKGRGFKSYDLWGIDSQRYPGVTRFKLQFGGQQVEYPGLFILPISQLKFNIYSLIKRLQGLIS